MTITRTESQGPDRHKGGGRCPQHHTGEIRTGLVDWCCCCNPCLYERSVVNTADHCCRCVPQILCFTFTPSAGCCGEVQSAPAFAVHNFDPPTYTTYSSGVAGLSITVSVGRVGGDAYGLCYWRVQIPDESVDETFAIDHKTVTCLEFNLSVSGLTNTLGCEGTLTVTNYFAEKIPFSRRDISTELVSYGGSPCECNEVPDKLCVYGQRTPAANEAAVSYEAVEFTWNAGASRWEYTECVGDDPEIITLVNDGYGCAFQFAFDENAWGDTLSIASCFTECDCGPFGESTASGFRYVRISKGPCSHWNYICGTCRCAPSTLCVFGEIDGVAIDGEFEWDGDKWASDAYTDFYLELAEDSCGDCVMTSVGSFYTDFEPSAAVECGKGLAFELYSDLDNSPTTFNWLWGQAKYCDCKSDCGFALCSGGERCDGPPAIMYVDLHAESICYLIDDPELEVDCDTPYALQDVCDLTVPVYFWQRFDTTLGVMDCGHVGFFTYSCNGTFYVKRLEVASGIVTLSSILPSGGSQDYELSEVYCDPLLWESATTGGSPKTCDWGCETIHYEQVTVSE